MLERITRAMYGLDIHLLYASAVCLAAWVMTSSRSISANTKYWILVAASLNFFLPLGAIVDGFGASHFGWASPLGFVGDAAATISRSLCFWLLWGVGTGLMLGRLCLRLSAERRGARSTSAAGTHGPIPLIAPGIPIKFTDDRRSPAVNGLLRPSISLPAGIERLLNESEIEAVLAHELIHAKRRDNLIRLIHEIGQCLLWWHPLVWITGRRLAQLSAHARPASRAAGALLGVLFGTLLFSGVFATISHTACCFVTHR